MLRLNNKIAGREPRNEDLRFYIQTFEILEQLFQAQNFGDFIVYGCVITGVSPSANISAGVIYQAGELCLFDGAAGVTFPLKLKKQTTGLNIRKYFDNSFKTTVNKIELVPDISGLFSFTILTPRANERFLRFENGKMRGNIGTVDDLTVLNHKAAGLQDLSGLFRVIPEPPAGDNYILLAQFETIADRFYELFFSGCSNNVDSFSARIRVQNVGGSGFCTVDVLQRSFSNGTDDPVFSLKNAGTTFELYVKSASTPLQNGVFTSGSITLTGQAERSGASSSFNFEKSFVWSPTVPTPLIPSVVRYIPNASNQGISGVFTSFSSITVENGIMTSLTI